MLSHDTLSLALFRPPIVLVVESRTAARNATCRLVRQLGYDGRMARDGLQAMRMLRQHPGLHHLVLSNVLLPDIDAGEFARQIADQGAGTKVALIAEYAPIGKAADVVRANSELPVLRRPFGFREIYEVLCPLIGPPRAALPLARRPHPPARRRHRINIR
jgi:DNA-binding NtrC family response regulator